MPSLIYLLKPGSILHQCVAAFAIISIWASCLTVNGQTIDLNQNQLPDIWEATYKYSGIASADDDFDGFTALQESLAGTDPYSNASCPSKQLLFQNGSPVLEWRTQPYKRYQIQGSTDLNSWYDWSGPFWGDGGLLETTEKALPSRYRFFRLGVLESLDSDGDGLTDWEESTLQTNESIADTDGDGVSDGDEVRMEADPLDSSNRPAVVQVLSGQKLVGTLSELLSAKIAVRVLEGDGSFRTVPFVNFESSEGTLASGEQSGLKTIETGISADSGIAFVKYTAVSLGSDKVTISVDDSILSAEVTIEVLADSVAADPFPRELAVVDQATDSDGDGLPDEWEFERFGNLSQGAFDDWDRDGTPNRDELNLSGIGRSPTLIDGDTPIDSFIGKSTLSSSVGQDGSANVSLPIEVPQGVNGLQPQLSLMYSSNQGLGNMRHGWSVSGLSSITRGGTNPAKDLVNDPLDYDENDLFFLDGNRLIASDGEYGANGTKYLLESDNQTLVISRRSEGADAVDHFEVRMKDGRIFTYGGDSVLAEEETNARISPLPNFKAEGTPRPATAWALSSVEDRFGNRMEVFYEQWETAVAEIDGYEEDQRFDGSLPQRLESLPSDYVPTRVLYGLRSYGSQIGSTGWVSMQWVTEGNAGGTAPTKFLNDTSTGSAFYLAGVSSGISDGDGNHSLFRRYDLQTSISQSTRRELVTDLVLRPI